MLAGVGGQICSHDRPIMAADMQAVGGGRSFINKLGHQLLNVTRIVA